MKTISKFLALIPVVGFAAACSGVAPTGPTSLASNDATAGSVSTTSRRPCAGPKTIELSINASSDATTVFVDATYHYSDPNSASCGAPEWTSDRSEMAVDKVNPFRVGFDKSAGGVATVKAVASNGVHNVIEFKIGEPVNSSPVPSPQICTNIVGMAVDIKQDSLNDQRVWLVASYVYDSAADTVCNIAPEWTSDRQGLLVSSDDAFQSSIEESLAVKTTVKITGANGATGSITF